MSQQEKKKRRIVKDSKGFEYTLIEKLGEGGQGIVCKTNYPNVLVKVSKSLSDSKYDKESKHLAWIMRLDLYGLPIARPLSLIQEKKRVGYVMELMDGLIPLKTFLETMQEKGINGFLETGGLQRRLILLAKLARTLAKLHGMGLAYGDLSPDNIFVSKEVEYSEVWLIDCDNICYHSRKSDLKIYSPDYGAPEIINDISGVNTYTDSWGFAVIAYQLLTMNHPLKGDVVQDGEPELEEKALAGDLPWVNHPEDKSNYCSGGIPSHLVFGKKLSTLMDQCFRAGLNTPEERPTMSTWAEAFEEAAAVTLKCEECESSFYYNDKQQCLFCEFEQFENKGLLFKEYFWLPPDVLPEGANSEKDCWIATDRAKVLQINVIELKPPIYDYLSGLEASSYCRLELKDGDLWIEPLSKDGSVLLQNNKKSEEIKRRMRLKKESKSDTDFFLHLGDFNKQHPVWRFRW